MSTQKSIRTPEECADEIVNQIVLDNMQKSSLHWLVTTAIKAERERAEREAVEAERDRCTDIIARHCSFAMENSTSQEIRNFASSLANRLYTVITNPNH